VKNSYKILIGCLVVGVIAIQVTYFFNPPQTENSCFTDFKFSLQLEDYSNASIVDEKIKKELGNDFSLPQMYTWGVYSPDSGIPPVYTLRMNGEHIDDSTMMNSVREILETMPEVSQITGPSIYCPSK
jgi:hypothetical protein